jgi:invasion protein IalB
MLAVSVFHNRPRRVAVAVAVLLFSAAALHAETLAPAAPEPVPTPAPADVIGTIYPGQAHGDWQMVCSRSASGADPCELSQLLYDAGGNPIVEVSFLELPPEGALAAVANIVTPLETFLPKRVALAVDGGTPMVFEFSFCTANGCVAQVGFDRAELEALKKGQTASVTIASAMNPDQPVTIAMSLAGSADGFEALAIVNAAARAAAGAASGVAAQPVD